MAYRSSLKNDDGTGGGVLHETGNALMRVVGGFGNASGPGTFMVQTIISGTTSAIAMGLGGSAVGAALFGTASLTFMLFSCVGFVYGSVGFYRNAMTRSLIALERNPLLMQLHLDANYPSQGFLRRVPERDEVGRSWVLQSMLVVSWLSAQPALGVSVASYSECLMDLSSINVMTASLRCARRACSCDRE